MYSTIKKYYNLLDEERKQPNFDVIENRDTYKEYFNYNVSVIAGCNCALKLLEIDSQLKEATFNNEEVFEAAIQLYYRVYEILNEYEFVDKSFEFVEGVSNDDSRKCFNWYHNSADGQDANMARMIRVFEDLILEIKNA